MSRVAVYSITRDRLDLTRKSFKALREWAGCEFDLYVADNGSGREMRSYLREEKSKGNIKFLQLNDENMGQNIATNDLLNEIVSREYDWVMRWDNDAMPRSRRFLKKLVRLGDRMMDKGGFPVLSPTILKLKHPPRAIAVAEFGEKKLEIVEILGGICRLHPAKMFETWRFSPYAPLGFGEAAEISRLCAEADIPMIRVLDIEVEHTYGEDGQVERWPEEFTWERREVGRYVSYGL